MLSPFAYKEVRVPLSSNSGGRLYAESSALQFQTRWQLQAFKLHFSRTRLSGCILTTFSHVSSARLTRLRRFLYMSTVGDFIVCKLSNMHAWLSEECEGPEVASNPQFRMYASRPRVLRVHHGAP